MEWDYSHHLSPSDSFAEPSLGPPCELCLCPACDTTHIGHKVGEESGVEGLSEWVDAELVEDVLTTGFFGGRAEIRTLKDDRLFCPAFHRKCPGGDSLPRMCELPLNPRSHT